MIDTRATVYITCRYSALKDDGGRWTVYEATARPGDSRRKADTQTARATTRRAAITAALSLLERGAIREPRRKRKELPSMIFEFPQTKGAK